MLCFIQTVNMNYIQGWCSACSIGNHNVFVQYLDIEMWSW